MNRVLVIEDAPEIALIISVSLKDLDVKNAPTLAEARSLLVTSDFDLLVLDAELPDGDGFRFFASLQNDPKYAKIPVIFVTGKGGVEDKVFGLSLGAADYVTKPFEPRELRARVLNRLRKSTAQIQEEELFAKGELHFNLSHQKLTEGKPGRSTRVIPVTAFEFKLLLYLARHEDHVFSREALIDLFWKHELDVLDRTVDAHMSRLRKKLGKTEYEIKSIYGEGYSFRRRSSA